jgi:hypothetical protein
MTWTSKFEQEPEEPMRPTACMLCEALLPDAVDGTLSAAEQRIFDAHVASCVDCSREMEEAQRGAAWLSMLKSQTPEPPVDLLAKILAGTTGPRTEAIAAPVLAVVPQAVPASWGVQVAGPRGSSWGPRWTGWRSRVADVFSIENTRSTFQPRFAMTAAMAFFSIALTLNLTGFRMRDLHADSFTPDGIRRTVSEVSASATRRFQNLRVVYQVEARVSELRDDQSPATDAPMQEGGAQDESTPGSTAPATTGPATTGPAATAPEKPGGGTQNQDRNQTPQDQRPHGRSELVLPIPERTTRSDAAYKAA